MNQTATWKFPGGKSEQIAEVAKEEEDAVPINKKKQRGTYEKLYD